MRAQSGGRHEMSGAAAQPDESTTFTFCRNCAARCGVKVTTVEGEVKRIAPDKANPYSWRDFCVKGRTANEVRTHPQRILEPMRRVGDRYEPASWDDAIADISERLAAIIEADGPDSVAMYTGNPSYFGSAAVYAREFMRALGSGNLFDVASVDQNAYIVATEQMYGVPMMHLIPDVDHCDLMLMVGANPAESTFGWLGAVPNGWRRALRAQAAGARIVIVDPYRTLSVDRADLHLAPVPGTDWALLLAMAKIILEQGLADTRACDLLGGMDRLSALFASASIPGLAARCGIEQDAIVSLAYEFATARTAFCQAHTGTALGDGAAVAQWLCLVLNELTGRIDVPGGRCVGPSVEPRPVGWAPEPRREPHRSRVRNLPVVRGAHSLAELSDEILTPGLGRVRALLTVAGNPVVSGPDGRSLARALTQLDLHVSIDIIQRESHRGADWLLPVPHWLEREDLLMGAGAAYAFLAPAAVEAPEGVREEWQIFAALAASLGVTMFGSTPGAPPPRHIWKQTIASLGSLDLDGLEASPHGSTYERARYGRLAEVIRTPDGRVDVAPIALLADARRLLQSPPTHDAAFPLRLVTRRRKQSMNSWLNDTATIHVQVPTNYVEVNTLDAAEAGLEDGDVVVLESAVGRVRMVACVSDRPRPGVVVSEHGWGSAVMSPATGTEVSRHGVNRNELVDASVLDPLAQVPRLNGQPVRISAEQLPPSEAE